MKFLPLVWAGIWRRKSRAVLTLLSIVNAFLIFGLLQGLASGVNNIAQETTADVLMTFSRVSQVEPLPMGHAAQIRTLPDVTAVTPMVLIAATYQRPNDFVSAVAVDVDGYLSVYSKVKASAAAVQAMRQVRNGALVSARVARNHQWRVGDTISLHSLIWTNADGSADWPLKIVGFSREAPDVMLNYSYLDEARTQAKGTTSFFVLKTRDPKSAARVAAQVDRLFANSPYETRTVTPRQLAQSQLKQVGDIGLVVSAVVGALFFALLFSVGAVMMQALRERTPELAVLKTLGFTDALVLRLVLAESLIFCLLSAATGLGLAELMFPLIRQTIGFKAAAGPVLFMGLGFSVLLAVACGLPPAWRAGRLQIVDALAVR